MSLRYLEKFFGVMTFGGGGGVIGHDTSKLYCQNSFNVYFLKFIDVKRGGGGGVKC